MPFLDKLTDKLGEMMKEKMGGSHEKEKESSDHAYDEHKSYGEHQDYGHSYAPPPAAGPPGSHMTLPPGWIQQWDPNSQRYFYVEQATGRTQWDPPTGGYGPSSDMHHLGGSVPGQYYSQDQRAMYQGGHDEHGGHYEGGHGEEKKSSHTGLALAGGAVLGVAGGAWAAHEYAEHEEEEQQAAQAAQYQSGYGAPVADPTMEAPAPMPEDPSSDVESEAESVHEAAEDVQDAQEEVAEASSESDREEAQEDLEEAQEDYNDEVEDYNEEVEDD